MTRGFALSTISGLAFLAAAALPAHAGEPHDWSGSYFGIKGGAAFSDTKVTDGGSISNSDNGGTIGILSGYNWQQGNWVFGIDSDSSYSSLDTSFGAASVETKYIGTTRARVGYAYDRLLPYVTAGLATAYVDATAASGESESEFLYGFAVGGGVEWAIDDTWQLRAEYLYIDYAEEDFRFTGGIAEIDVEDVHLVRVGISMDTDWVLDSLLGN
ncbi:outer membrane protein [Coralliovum pocilloporae]|uniref:outer membrane protein n=1 Tax=Coralliovum pocilloporae TaxID=3066369 RepID=UPI0033079A39